MSKSMVKKAVPGAAQRTTDRLAAATALAAKLPGSSVGTEFGGGSLTIDGKIFAFTSKNDHIAIKLPVDRIEALLGTADAERLTMGKRTMREWIVISDAGSPGTLRLLREALRFVQSLPASKPKKKRTR